MDKDFATSLQIAQIQVRPAALKELVVESRWDRVASSTSFSRTAKDGFDVAWQKLVLDRTLPPPHHSAISCCLKIITGAIPCKVPSPQQVAPTK
jgi:hypothetical protein